MRAKWIIPENNRDGIPAGDYHVRSGPPGCAPELIYREKHWHCWGPPADAVEFAADNQRAEQALAGLEELHRYIVASETDEDAHDPSAADTCAALYELMGDLGLVVP